MSFENFNATTCPLEAGKPVLVEASAGTGKTTAIEHLVIRLLLDGIRQSNGETKIPEISEILVVTFTEAATAELIMRIRAKVVQALEGLAAVDDATLKIIVENAVVHSGEDAVRLRLKSALANFDSAAICTIHGFCARMLREFAIESGENLNTELVADDRELISEAIEDYCRKTFYGNDVYAYAAASAFGLNRNELCNLAGRVNAVSGWELLESADSTPKEKLLYEINRIVKDFRPAITAAEPRFNENSSLLLADPRKALEAAIDCFQGEERPRSICSVIRWVAKGEIRTSRNKPWNTENGAQPKEFGVVANGAAHFEALGDRYATALRRDFIKYLSDPELMAAKKSRSNIKTFNDLLQNTMRAVKNNPRFAELVRKRYHCVLIDEFQDTDPVQYYIFNKIFNTANGLMLMVGDPKQSIYSFRGADIYAYLEAQSDVQERYTLRENYRSTPEFINACNALFDCDKPFVEEGINYIPVESGREVGKLVVDGADFAQDPIEFCDFNLTQSQENASQETVCRIINLLNLANKTNSQGQPRARIITPDGLCRPVRPGDIAVLPRAHNQANQIRAKLVKAGVPAVIKKTGNVFQTEEAKELCQILSAVLAPTSNRLLLSALSTALCDLNANQLAELGNASGEEEMEKHRAAFIRFRELWEEKGFLPMFRVFQHEYDRGLTARLMPERHLTDVAHLVELLHQAETGRRLGMEGTAAWLLQMVNKDWRDAEPEEYQQRLESDADAVNIITMHASKGLQFPLVFCPGVWQSNKTYQGLDKQGFIFANPEKGYRKELELGSPNACQNFGYYMNQQLAEWMRLFYVGVTRAKYYCFVAWRRKLGGGDGDLVKPIEYLLGCHGIPDGDFSKFDGTGVNFNSELVMLKSAETRVILPQAECPPLSAEEPPLVPGGFKIMSYSSLTANVHEHDFTPGAEEQITSGESSVAATGNDVPIFADFPGGALSGDCVHAVFEQLDFPCVNNSGWQKTGQLQRLLDDNLKRFGRVAGSQGTEVFEQNLIERREQLAALVEQTLKTPLLPQMRLAEVKADARLAELEFYFSVPVAIAVEKLEALLRCYFPCNAWGDGALLNFDFAKSGFMNGKIDLVFKADGKYWLADWKTNMLGRAYSNYTTDAIRNSMVASRYPVQAAIYTVALHRFLRQRLSNYCPEKHFGGIFYLYVRGMNGNSADTGVYHMPYCADFVESLEEIFPGGTHERQD